MKSYLDMSETEFKRFLKTATAPELITAFCANKTSDQIEVDLARAQQ